MPLAAAVLAGVACGAPSPELGRAVLSVGQTHGTGVAPACSMTSARPMPNACPLDSVQIWMDDLDAVAAPQVHVRAPNGTYRQWELRLVPAGTEIFHWDETALVASWAAQQAIPPQTVLTRGDGYNHYRGVWVSLHPFDSMSYGSDLLVSTLMASLRAVVVPFEDGPDPFDAFAEAAGFGPLTREDTCSWARRLQEVGIGAIGKQASRPRTAETPWPDWLAVSDPAAFARVHAPEHRALMSRLRTVHWPAEQLALPPPLLKLIALVRVASYPDFSLEQLPLTFFDDAPWLHQLLTHGTVQGELPTFRVKQLSYDIKSCVCQMLPELPGWQPSSLYARLAGALCHEAEAAAEASGEET